MTNGVAVSAVDVALGALADPVRRRTVELLSLRVIGTITVWQPPERLVLSWRHASFPPGLATELHVTFESTGTAQARVTIEHYGWDDIPCAHAARHQVALPMFQLRFAQWWRNLLHEAFP